MASTLCNQEMARSMHDLAVCWWHYQSYLEKGEGSKCKPKGRSAPPGCNGRALAS